MSELLWRIPPRADGLNICHGSKAASSSRLRTSAYRLGGAPWQ